MIVINDCNILFPFLNIVWFLSQHFLLHLPSRINWSPTTVYTIYERIDAQREDYVLCDLLISILLNLSSIMRGSAKPTILFLLLQYTMPIVQCCGIYLLLILYSVRKLRASIPCKIFQVSLFACFCVLMLCCLITRWNYWYLIEIFLEQCLYFVGGRSRLEMVQ